MPVRLAKYSIWVVLTLCFCSGKALASWHIKARKMLYYMDRKLLIAEGKVILHGEGFSIYCPRLRYNLATNRLTFWGPVKIVSNEGDFLTGAQGWLNLKTLAGEIEQAHLYLKRNDLHVIAKEIDRLAEGEYQATRALITTCPVCGPSCPPAWSFRCRRLRITSGGQGKAYHATFNVGRLPILYSPYFAMAFQAERKSGFLLPRLVHGSREGFGLEIPFYWAVNDSLDLTLFPYYTAKRGFMTGLEVRYALSAQSKGVLRYRYLHDRQYDDDYNHDGLVRTNKHRYWLTAKVDQVLAPSWIWRLDLDFLSDRDFLYEFEGGKLGFDESHRSYLAKFGRGLDEKNTTYRTNRLWLIHPGDSFFFQTSATYYDSLVPGQQEELLMPLPRVDLQWLRTSLWGPFSLAVGIRGTNWWREEGFRGQRLEFTPEIALSPHFLPLDLDMVYRWRQTYYWVDWRDTRGQENKTRQLYEVDVRSGLTFYHVYHWQDSEIRALRHSLRPEVRYFYRPAVKQTDFPLFTEADRLPPVNSLRYGLLQYFTAKQEGTDGPRYFDLARVWLYQNFDFSASPKPFSDLFLDAEFWWPQSFSFRLESAYNFYGEGFYSLSVTSTFTHGQGEYLGLNYRWDKVRDLNQLGIRLKQHLYGGLFALIDLQKSLKSGELLASQWGLSYQAQCWSANLVVSSNPDETRFSFVINLRGIGGWGRSFSQ